MTNTNPAYEVDPRAAAPHLNLAPFWKDEETGAVYVHQDLAQVTAPFENEGHTGPVELIEHLGDVQSWCEYVTTFDVDGSTLCSWSENGLRAILDYPDRRTWSAMHMFKRTPEFNAWASIATGSPIEHRKAVEFLEDHAPEIQEPDQGSLLELIRSLRGTVNASAETDLRQDGTSSVRFSKDSRVVAGGDLTLPPEITIAIPVIRGHIGADGLPVRFKLVVKLRASVGADAHLALRLTMPWAEVVLEQVYAELVASAKAQLGEKFTILRAAP